MGHPNFLSRFSVHFFDSLLLLVWLTLVGVSVSAALYQVALPQVLRNFLGRFFSQNTTIVPTAFIVLSAWRLGQAYHLLWYTHGPASLVCISLFLWSGVTSVPFSGSNVVLLSALLYAFLIPTRWAWNQVKPVPISIVRPKKARNQ